MRYKSGIKISIKDRVEVEHIGLGIVVCVIDDGVYSDGFEAEDWCYLESGILIRMDDGGLIHYPEVDADLQLK